MHIMRTVVFALLAAPVAVLAEDVDREVEMQFVIADDTDETIRWDMGGADFEMADLAVGESRTIENEDGRTITLTRTEDGMQVDVDGKTIELPHFAAHAMMFDASDIDVDLTGGDIVGDFAVAIDGAQAIQAHPPAGVTILSATPLDDAVRESIRSVLISAGIDEEVRFVDGSEPPHQVHVIRRIETL